MSLKSAGSLATKESIETIIYSPGLQDSGDLEAATKTITATAEPAIDDYSVSLTLTASPDLRLQVKRIAARLAVTIDTADGNLRVRVYVDNTSNLLFDLTLAGTGQKLNVVDVHSANLAAIFNLLKDGAAHTFKWRIWKDGGGAGAVISEVRLWEAVGSWDNSNTQVAWSLAHKGLVHVWLNGNRVGTGTHEVDLTIGGQVWSRYFAVSKAAGSALAEELALVADIDAHHSGTVATDINYTAALILVLRSEV